MSDSIKIPLTMGAIYWTPSRGYNQRRVTCPECAGTKVITLILGNGSQHEIDCNHCQSGYDPPRGWITENYWEAEPEPFVPLTVNIERGVFKFSAEPPEREPYCSKEVSDIFVSKDECLAKCAELNAQHNRDEECRAIAMLESSRRKSSFSVSYWRAQRTKLLKDLERIEKQLRNAKATQPGGKP